MASPLLANIALHGLEEAVKAAFPRTRMRNGVVFQWRPQVVRYADDFVVLHHDRSAIEQAKQVVTEWLQGIGLELKPSKTRIVHTLHEYAGQPPGFDFLGFTVRHLPAGKTHSAKVNGRPKSPRLRGYNTSIKPSRQAVRNHEQHLKRLITVHQAQAQGNLIRALNRVIAGWSNYYRSVYATRTFVSEDHRLFIKLLRWARRRHPDKPAHWVVRKYWHPERGRWDFAADDVVLRKHAQTRIRRHIKVNGVASPFDGNWLYWTTRLGTHPTLPRREALLLKRQSGKCAWCGLYFGMGEQWELDHRVPRSFGGTDDSAKLQLLHQHCHDRKTAQDGVR